MTGMVAGMVSTATFEATLRRWASSRDPDRDPAVLVADVPDLAALRRRHGRDVADEVLAELTRRLTAVLPEDGMVCRLGPGRFAIALRTGAGRPGLRAVATRVQDRCAGTFATAAGPLPVHVRLGGAAVHASEEAAVHLLRRAARMLTTARFDPGRPLALAEPPEQAGQAEPEAENDTAAALDRAATDGTLRDRYMPIVDLATHEVLAFEALVRWCPDGRLVPPADFLPLAERTGAVVGIDTWMLGRACASAVRLQAESGRPIQVSVNFSARHFVSDTWPAVVVAQALERSGLDPRSLIVELTESAGLPQIDRAATCLAAIREMGCSVAIDDYGTGHAALRYLAELPVSTVKIDQSFTRRIAARDRAIIAVTAGLLATCRALGLGTIAEGIETPRDEESMRRLGVQLGQGYLYGRPVPLEDALRLVRPGPAGDR